MVQQKNMKQRHKRAGKAGGATRGQKSGRVRIIAGSYRRMQLPVLVVEGLRPTPDRVRETLFNWLGQSLQGWVCVDAFAGSGALGFEAASRGAQAVYLLETNEEVAQQLRASREHLGAGAVSVLLGGANQGMSCLYARGVRVDLVFLDPPFAAPELLWSALAMCEKLLLPDGLVYVECSAKLRAKVERLGTLEPLEKGVGQGRWQVVRSATAGVDFFALLQRCRAG